MTPFASPSLAACVGNAGGVGGVGLTDFSPEDIERRLGGFRQMSTGSLNANLLLWPDRGNTSNLTSDMRSRLESHYAEKNLGELPVVPVRGSEVTPQILEVLRRFKPEVMSFHFGLPAPDMLAEIKSIGSFVISSATTVSEAKALEAAGADAIIAQGTEAGGHRGTHSGVEVTSQSGLFSLLPQVVAAVSVPVIAAGGIHNGRTIAAALMLGASAVQIGTAFLRCHEAFVSDAHRAALRSADDIGTTVSKAFTGAPARVVRNRLSEEFADLQDDALPFPAQEALTQPLAEGDDRNYLPLYAGQSVALTREMPATDLFNLLIDETEQRFKEVLG